jgi:hypothetical protein
MIIQRPDYFIGIDPDVKASGFAVWHKKQLELCCYDLPELFDALFDLSTKGRLKVRLEAGWHAKGLNWHKGGLGSANAVGRNHEIGRQIEKYCLKYDIPYELVKPLGYSGWKHERFCTYTKWPVKCKTNPETRVAGLLVYGY